MSVYKGNKLVAGGSIDTHFVRKPAWNQAVVVSVADLTTGYKAPADGMIVGLLFTNESTSTGVSISVNGVEIARNKAKDSDRILNVQCLVNKDNVIKITGDDAGITKTSAVIRFVPFEDSTVSDVEVVTPEYIRNQNILSDLESITISTSSSSPTVMPYDGVIYVSYKAAGSTPGKYYLNGQQVLWFEGQYGTASNSGTLTVKKGDTVYVEFNGASPSAFARFYKLRDYTGR